MTLVKVDKDDVLRCCEQLFDFFEEKDIPKELAAVAMAYVLSQLKREGIMPMALFEGEE